MLIKWQRHIFYRLLFHSFWLLATICGIYTLVEFSMKLPRHNVTLPTDFFFRYLSQLSYEGSTLLPFVVLLASLITTFYLVDKKELLSITCVGYSLKKTCFPYIVFALVCALLMGWIQNVVTPYFSSHTPQKQACTPLRCISLSEKGHLIAHSNEKKDQLEDLYWIVSSDTLYYIDTLTYVGSQAFTNNFVKFKKNPTLNCWEVMEKQKNIPIDLGISKESLLYQMIPSQTFSKLGLEDLKTACTYLPAYSAPLTHLLYRFYTLFLVIFCALFPPLFAFQFNRTFPWLTFIGSTLVLFFLLRVFSKSCLITASLSSFIPFISLLTLSLLLLIIVSVRYAKL